MTRDYHREIAEERDRLRALNAELLSALAEMIKISKRNSEPGLMLLAIRMCAAHAIAKTKG